MDPLSSDNKPSVAAAGSRRDWCLYFGILILFAALYGATAQRGVGWQDSGVFQLRVMELDLAGELGLALSHPLVIVLGRAFSLLPFGPVAWRINLLSAVAGAFAVANIALLVRRLAPQRPAAAWVAGGLFGLAHSPWWLATICESQCLLAALFTAELHVWVSLVRRPRERLVLLLGLVNGLALMVHDLALLALPAWGVTVLALCLRGRVRWRSVVALAAGWALGAAGFLGMIVERAVRTGPGDAVRSALFGVQWSGQVLGAGGDTLPFGLGYVLFNFPNPGLVLAIIGLWTMRKHLPRALARGFGYLALVYFLFAVRYDVADQFMFFLPFYALVAVLSGVALGRGCPPGRRGVLLLLVTVSVAAGPVLYAAAPTLWKHFALPLPGRKDLAYRDPGRYWLVPWKAGEDSAERYARDVLRQVPPGGIVFADNTALPPLRWVQRLEGLGPGVTVLKRLKEGLPPGVRGRKDVFVLSTVRGHYPAPLDELARFAKDTPEAIVYRVVWKAPGSVPPGP